MTEGILIGCAANNKADIRDTGDSELSQKKNLNDWIRNEKGGRKTNRPLGRCYAELGMDKETRWVRLEYYLSAIQKFRRVGQKGIESRKYSMLPRGRGKDRGFDWKRWTEGEKKWVPPGKTNPCEKAIFWRGKGSSNAAFSGGETGVRPQWGLGCLQSKRKGLTSLKNSGYINTFERVRGCRRCEGRPGPSHMNQHKKTILAKDRGKKPPS